MTKVRRRARIYLICGIFFAVLCAATFLTRGSSVMAWGDAVIACIWLILSLAEYNKVRSARKSHENPADE